MRGAGVDAVRRKEAACGRHTAMTVHHARPAVRVRVSSVSSSLAAKRRECAKYRRATLEAVEKGRAELVIRPGLGTTSATLRGTVASSSLRLRSEGPSGDLASFRLLPRLSTFQVVFGLYHC
ncbi:hypothetical protein HPB50_014345 [Hyalomma asiaticum]|uniref:Uncharacterized protein n=1 Tax=Hyalomma asiaticum TaxID=266040 RepID=A0ACB7SEF6_HYAAI|nr:hypothetical protein HPB50_014345 [Hyalomma asiaticum]